MKSMVSVAEAKARFSELVNRAAYGGERIVITKRGKPIAVLSAPSGEGLASVRGWLEKDDPFFKDLHHRGRMRHRQKMRVLREKG